MNIVVFLCSYPLMCTLVSLERTPVLFWSERSTDVTVMRAQCSVAHFDADRNAQRNRRVCVLVSCISSSAFHCFAPRNYDHLFTRSLHSPSPLQTHAAVHQVRSGHRVWWHAFWPDGGFLTYEYTVRSGADKWNTTACDSLPEQPSYRASDLTHARS